MVACRAGEPAYAVGMFWLWESLLNWQPDFKPPHLSNLQAPLSSMGEDRSDPLQSIKEAELVLAGP